MKPLIVANWKLNPVTQKEANKLFDATKKKAKNKNVDVVICPPFVYLPLCRGVVLGAQNIFWEQKGAFTGEISAAQLKDLQVKYVIVGHSERRKYFHEIGEMLNEKIKMALASDLIPILCVGENEGQNRSDVLQKQLIEALQDIPESQAKNIVIAYEPIWAIGTGKNCSVEQTIHATLFIRKVIMQLYGHELGITIKILYGGSVNSSNSADYVKNAGVNGLLVGGASLDANEFANIVKSVS